MKYSANGKWGLDNPSVFARIFGNLRQGEALQNTFHFSLFLITSKAPKTYAFGALYLGALNNT